MPTIDLDKVLETARLGVRRAMVFMGLGVNTANDPNFSNYKLSKDQVYLDFVPDNLPPENIEEFKAEFKRWVIGNGLRELIEVFHIFLDHVFEVCLFAFIKKGKANGEDFDEKVKEFTRHDLRDKLKTLKKDFSVEPNFPDQLKTINKARTCLTHRRGIVGKKDITMGDQLVLRWRALNFYFEKDSGEKQAVDLPLDEPQLFEGPGDLKVGFTEKQLGFKMGTQVEIQPNILAELCLAVLNSSKEIIQTTQKALQQLGIKKT